MDYREDINGLRAIAVLGVLIFHFGFDTLSGGFAGVDVFFVISGYLITSILINEISKSSFSYLKFYEKRIRRLFPALFATAFSSFIAGYFIFMPDELKELGQSLIATVAYLSNIFFWLKSDYFSGPSELKPLLHTWSLAVEEQYYLIFPTVAVLCLKRGMRLFTSIIITLIIISFTASMLLIESYPSMVFYISPFRFWELLAGSLLAVVVNKKIFLPKPLNNTAPYIGLSLIILSFFVLNERVMFPGWAALMPVAGSILIIWARPSKSLFNSILSSQFMQFTGKISYSLYLWHWPIVVFYGYWIIREFELIEKILLLTVTYIVAWLSWRFIEHPFRYQKSVGYTPKLTYFSAISTSIILVFVGFYLHIKEGIPSRVDMPVPMVEVPAKSRELLNKSNTCFLNVDESYLKWRLEECKVQVNDSNHYTLLWGDSHSNHLWAGLKANAKNLKENIILYASAGCPPIFDVTAIGRPNCKGNNDHVRKMLKDIVIDKVILAASWNYAERVGGVDLQQLTSTLKELQQNNIDTIVVAQGPIYSLSNPQFLARRLGMRDDPNEDYWMKPTGGKRISEKVKNFSNGTPVFEPMSFFCHEQRCKIYADGHLMVEDNSHLSKYGSIELTKELIEFLNKN